MAKEFSTVKGRWEGVGPYYAMFPTDFSDWVIQQFTTPGQKVLDPFAGRGTSLFSAAVAGRQAFGVEICPVGWIYGKAKLETATQYEVEERILTISRETALIQEESLDDLPPFFRACYSSRVLRFLLTARSILNWRTKSPDWTTLALLLIYLHGRRDQTLSNQMRQGKAMSPGYSVAWWQEHGLTPPEIDPEQFILRRVRWRFAKGIPRVAANALLLGDSCEVLDDLRELGPFDLLFTSPPYRGVTNYHYDQWLRLWLMGGESIPKSTRMPYCGKFESKTEYRSLLSKVFSRVSTMLSSNATIYVRIDARTSTFEQIVEVLREVFPDWRFQFIRRPFTKQTQTALYGDKNPKPGEVDVIGQRKRRTIPLS